MFPKLSDCIQWSIVLKTEATDLGETKKKTNYTNLMYFWRVQIAQEIEEEKQM